MKVRTLLLASAILYALIVLAGVAQPALAQGQSGTTLTSYKTASGQSVRTFDWTIEKAVTPDSWNLMRGDSGTSQYTVTVTKTGYTDTAYIEGEVCVTNGGAVATENLQIVDEVTMPPSQVVIASVNVDLSAHPVLQPGETVCYPYHVDIPAGYVSPGATYKNTAHITITNHSGHLGEPFGPSPSATTTLPASPTLVNDTIHVEDTNGGSWAFSDSGSVTYERTFTCDADEGSHENTATIVETGQSDSATVTVTCWAPEVTLDIDPDTFLTRTYDWTIDKSADQTALTLSLGQQFQVNYSVTVNATYTDGDWSVAGNIWVHNPGPIPATINGVSVVIAPDIPGVVTSPVTFPYALPAGETLHCTYTAALPDASTRTVTGTVTIQNFDYDYLMNPTPDGTTDLTGTTTIDFGNVVINQVDECIDVSDTYAGLLGTVCYGVDTLPKTFTYSRWIGPYGECGDYTVTNTASFVTNDTQATGSDSWTVNVHVPCVGGCTLTPGYWKTHSEFGPAPYDDTWAQLANGASTPFFDTGKTWYQVLWTPPSGGNAYYILAHAYIAAYLNGLNGADTSAVSAELTHAAQLLNQYDGNPNSMSQIKGAVRNDFIATAQTLDQYNNGYIGPGHCSE